MAIGMKSVKRNEIQLDPTKYNLMLIGESGIGKTTVIKEYCEKLVGNDSYVFLEMGKEDGGDAIDGINYFSCPEWDKEYDEESGTVGFSTIIDDIVENKTTDWADLKIVVVDTADELFNIAEPEVINMHNKDNPTKRVKSIKAAFGGFQAGEDKTIEIVLDKLWDLKKVGVSFIIIGHTKSRNVTDAVTGEDYMQLTTNMPQKYFNALKTKVHFLGVAAIDREIVKESTGKKDIVTRENIKKGVIKSESRQIIFRDNNFVVDAKSRFANIIDKIPLDSDALIKAIKDAILAEQKKSGKSIEVAQREQFEQNKKRMEYIAEQERQSKQNKEIEDIKNQIVNFFTVNKNNSNAVMPVLTKVREFGYSNPLEIDNLEHAKSILDLIEQ